MDLGINKHIPLSILEQIYVTVVAIYFMVMHLYTLARFIVTIVIF